MKKKFIRVMFFGALALTTFSYLGCKDYDDDIDRLEQKITENANAIAEINKLIEGGSVITKVENITGGVEVTLSNGKSFTIKNGDAGKDGTQWTIGDDGYWYQDGKKTEFKAKGDKGDQGASRELQVLRVNRENQDSRVLQVKTVIPIFQVKTDSGTRMK